MSNLRTLSALFLILIFSVSAAAPPPAQPPTVIKAKKIYTATGGTIEDGMILVANGKIAEVGKNIVVPQGAREISAEVVIPGLIDVHSHIGLFSIPLIEGSYDGNEATNPVTPQLRAFDGFNFDDRSIPPSREAGVTTIVSRPGSLNVIGGTSIALKLKDASPAEMVIKEDCDLKMAIEGNPSGYYGNLQRMPSTLMGVYYLARKAFVEAREYQATWDLYEKNRAAGRAGVPPPRDLGKDVLVRVLKRELPVHIHVYTASEIMSAIRLADEFGFKLSLGHCDKSYLIVDELAKRKDVYYNVGPAVFDVYYQNALEFANVPAILAKAGLKVSLQTDSSAGQPHLREFASLCVRYGMSEEDALKAVTIHAAESVDLGDRIGSIEPGKDADLVLLDGPPFEFLTSVQGVLIDGNIEYAGNQEIATGSALPPPPVARPLNIPAAADEVGRYAVKGGTIYTMEGDPVVDGVVLVEDGKIKNVGRDIPIPAGMPVIDAAGGVVMPGLVMARSHLGLTSNFRMQTSTDESSVPVTPAVSVKHAIEPQHPHFHLTSHLGITSALVTPGDLNVIGGRGVAVKTWGKIVDDLIVKDDAVMVFGLGEQAKRKQTMPSTRMGVAALIRETLTRAREYMIARGAASGDKDKKPLPSDVDMEALIPVLKGGIPVIVHCERKDDILTALRIADEFKLKIILAGATEAYKVVDEIKKRNVPVILEELFRGVGNVEDEGFNVLNPVILSNAGITVALRSREGLWFWPAAGLPGGDLMEVAAFACRFGMSESAALRAITIDAARIAGIADRVGSLKAGKDADILILSGHPFRTTAIPQVVIIDGKVVYQKKDGAHLKTDY